jgi:transcriptional regulator with XRE-family HTH domain
MPQLASLVDELKRYLRKQGITYQRIAQHLGMSESNVKRMFSRQSFSAKRLEAICNLAGLEIADLVDLMNQRREYLTELTPEQEEALLRSPQLLLLTYLLLNGWQLEEVTRHFMIDPPELDRLLIQLHRAKIIELLPLNRFKLLTARNFSWRKDGPIQRLFSKLVQREFLDSRFEGEDEQFRFVAGLLSPASLAQMKHSIDRLAREFDELNKRDSALPIAQRRGCSAVFAMRPWEFSVFAELRRDRAERPE